MRHQTAVRRLRMVAERCQRVSGLWDDEPVLVGAYAFGAVPVLTYLHRSAGDAVALLAHGALPNPG